MKKVILMLVCAAWIGNSAVLVATSCNSQKSQHACCITKMETCKTQCTMSHEKVKSTEAAVFPQIPQLDPIEGRGIISYLQVILNDLSAEALAKVETKNDLVPIPIYIQYHQFLI